VPPVPGTTSHQQSGGQHGCTMAGSGIKPLLDLLTANISGKKDYSDNASITITLFL